RFDPENDLHLDELACLLLERFRRDGDAEAFALLFELTGRRLERIAARLAARLRPAAPPHELIGGLKSSLWAGEGAPLTGTLFALARGLMERRLRAERSRRGRRPALTRPA